VLASMGPFGLVFVKVMFLTPARVSETFRCGTAVSASVDNLAAA